MDVDRTPRSPAPGKPGPASKPPDARSTARRRKRQAVAASLVAFGATWALVLTNPVASAPASTTADGQAGTTGGGQAGPAANAPGGQPAPSFFAPNRGTVNQAPVTNLRPGSRGGSLRSGGS